MERENRYLVLKLEDIDAYLEPSEKILLSALGTSVDAGRALDDKPELECVVVESDWPEYDSTWKAIEKRVDKHRAVKTPTTGD